MFWDRFYQLCKAHGTKPNPVAKALGISSATITKWKSGSDPQSSNVKKIADYFGVSVDYLLGNEEIPNKEPKRIPQPNALFYEDRKVRMIPVYESASAGFGSMAQDYIIDYQPCMIRSDSEAAETIFIRVQGDSMFPKIENGDLIQVHKQTSVDSGDIAVVMIDGSDGFVKKVVYGETWIELHSINPMYQTMRYNGREVTRVKVVGLVKSIIKKV